MPEATYVVNEIFLSPQGEGVRAGIAHVFVRFAFCDLTCAFCDTEFASGKPLTAAEILAACVEEATTPASRTLCAPDGARPTADHGPKAAPVRNVLFTGGEPLLQVDGALVELFHRAGWFVAVETNGRHEAPPGIDWIACSPKGAEHGLRLKRADEIRYVRGRGQGIPRPSIAADHHLLSPLFDGSSPASGALEACLQLQRENPGWRLSMQSHKAWGVR